MLYIGIYFLHKYLHPIYFKNAHISQLLDFIAIQQLHTSRAFVEVVAKRNTACQDCISPLRVHSFMSTGSKMFTWAYTNLLSWKKIWEIVVDVVAVVAKLTGAHSDELTRQIIENGKKLAALRAYAKTA